jgi:hypothetical protein
MESGILNTTINVIKGGYAEKESRWFQTLLRYGAYISSGFFDA